MAKKTVKEELEEIAKAFCDKNGLEFIFANEYKFGFQDKNEQLWTMSYDELYEYLKEKNDESR